MSIQIPQEVLPILGTIFQVFKNWWWVLPIFFLWRPFLFIWRWSRMEKYDAAVKKVLLEVRMPKEVIKPVKGMDVVFAGLHAIHDVFTWREKWLEGQFQLNYSFEIVSLGGEVHFYIRTAEAFRHIVESNIYSQYPEAEIFEVPDYVKAVPQDIPNKEWDLFGMDMINTKPSAYPIKTYLKFEEETQAKEEKRVDPLAGFLEGLATLKPGEQLWLQIIAKPIRDEIPWKDEALKIRDEIVGRKKPEEDSFLSFLLKGLGSVITGVPPGYEEKKEFEQESETRLGVRTTKTTGKTTIALKKEDKGPGVIPIEMKLTPGEREIVFALEQKISKFAYDCNMRYIYLGKKDAFFKPMARTPYGFFKSISSENMGGFKPDKHSITKMKSPFFWPLDSRRVYLRKRHLFRYYCRRMTPKFPRPGGTYVLNTEELATLFHFPGRTVAPAPSVPRIETKKGEAPTNLPTE